MFNQTVQFHQRYDYNHTFFINWWKKSNRPIFVDILLLNLQQNYRTLDLPSVDTKTQSIARSLLMIHYVAGYNLVYETVWIILYDASYYM